MAASVLDLAPTTPHQTFRAILRCTKGCAPPQALCSFTLAVMAKAGRCAADGVALSQPRTSL